MTREQMKLCKDCKWFEQEIMGECNHKHNQKINFITGGTLRRMFAQDSRESTGENWCGYEGKHWEAKNV